MVRVIVMNGDVREGETAAREAVLDHIRLRMGHRPDFVVALFSGDGWTVELHSSGSYISRIRRVTGYLSDLRNFGAAKAAEEGNRRANARMAVHHPMPSGAFPRGIDLRDTP